MQKIKIKNRKNQKIMILLELAENSKGLAFVMHGLGGFKEQKHIETFASAFKEQGISVIRFDTTNTFGESDGNYGDATVTNYYEDLEDVIKWAKKQDWYKGSFYLSGHSLGGICTSLYAENHPEEVKALAPISTIISGKLTFIVEKNDLKKWQETGYQIKESSTKKGLFKKLKWSFMIDLKKYDILKEVNN